MPWSNSQHTKLGVLCPARLSRTSSIRSGGNSALSVMRSAKPACQRSQFARFSGALTGTGGVGSVSRIVVNPDKEFSRD